MKRRGFLAALLGLTAAPLLAKIKAPASRLLGFKVYEVIGDTYINPAIADKIDISGLLSTREHLAVRIQMAREEYTKEHGKVPNNIYLGKDEYDIWTKDHPEVFGHGVPIWSESNFTRHYCDYATAYDMVVYVKTPESHQDVMLVHKLDKDWPEWTSCVEQSHLSVAYCSKDHERGIHQQVIETRGYKVK